MEAMISVKTKDRVLCISGAVHQTCHWLYVVYYQALYLHYVLQSLTFIFIQQDSHHCQIYK